MIAIRKQPGDPQNAIMAALSVADLKHVVIVDDEIDVYDAMEVEWAMATRVQADRDITILSNARSKPLDPSLPLSEGIPTTAKCGIDATIPDGVPNARYQRITYPHADELDLDDYTGVAGADEERPAVGNAGGTADSAGMVARIRELVALRPMYFSEIAPKRPRGRLPIHRPGHGRAACFRGDRPGRRGALSAGIGEALTMWSFDFASLALRYAQDERETSAVRPEPFVKLRTGVAERSRRTLSWTTAGLQILSD